MIIGTITLPPGFTSYTREQRRAWAKVEIRAIAREMLADCYPAASPAHVAAYMADVEPTIDAALREVAR